MIGPFCGCPPCQGNFYAIFYGEIIPMRNDQVLRKHIQKMIQEAYEKDKSALVDKNPIKLKQDCKLPIITPNPP
jgi:hypothetical protein